MTSAPLILVLGPQGSGKGTQVELLASRYHLSKVSAGALFRDAATQPTPLGRRIAARLQAGQLVTIDQWEAIVGAYLDGHQLRAGFLLDGLLRSLDQVVRFDNMLAVRQLDQPWVVSITLDDGTATERLLKRGRDDDTVAQIRERLAWTRTQAQPVIEHYRSLGRLVEVDGNQTIDDVHRDVVAGLTAIGAL